MLGVEPGLLSVFQVEIRGGEVWGILGLLGILGIFIFWDFGIFEIFEDFMVLFLESGFMGFRFTEIGSWPYDPEIAFSQNQKLKAQIEKVGSQDINS